MAHFYRQDTDMDSHRHGGLKQACASGSLARVRSILHPGGSISQILPPHENPTQIYLQECLFQAFANRHLDVVRYLLREARVEWKPVEHALARHAATKMMPIEMFEFLVQEGWNVNSPVYQHTPALSLVLNSFPQVKWFIENGADPNLGPDAFWSNTRYSAMIPDSGYVLGRAACTNPETAIGLLEYLIEHGLSLKNGIPLHLVSRLRPYDPTVKDQMLASIFPNYSNEKDLLDVPASASRVPVIRYLLDLGFDPNASDAQILGPRSIGSPLHYAIRGGAVENARYLLENGADPWADNYLEEGTLQAARYGLDKRREAAMQKLLREWM